MLIVCLLLSWFIGVNMLLKIGVEYLIQESVYLLRILKLWS